MFYNLGASSLPISKMTVKLYNTQIIITKPGSEVIKLFSCSTRLSTKFILLINVKMPTVVGILTFISINNTSFERLKGRNIFNFLYFSFYEQLKFHAQLS